MAQDHRSGIQLRCPAGDFMLMNLYSHNRTAELSLPKGLAQLNKVQLL